MEYDMIKFRFYKDYFGLRYKNYVLVIGMKDREVIRMLVQIKNIGVSLSLSMIG